MKIAVAMSGGVDSSAAAALLKEQGHELVGFTMQLWNQRRNINTDENGDPLPKAMYDALHTGDASIGGLNTNVLMLVHIPGDGTRATAISIMVKAAWRMRSRHIFDR